MIGKFYKSDCNCIQNLCKIGCKKCLLQKALEFYSILPITYIGDEFNQIYHYLNREIIDIDEHELSKKINRIYNTMENKLQLADYKFKNLKLRKENKL